VTQSATIVRPQGRAASRLLAVIFLATILIGLNATMISIALPTIVSDLGATADEGAWMLLAYLLLHGSMLVASGQLGDAWSPGAVFRIGLIIFLGSAVMLVLVGGAGGFIALRAAQGLAAAMLLSTAGAMIALAFPRERIGHAMGIYLAGFAAAQVAGPSIGGLITAHIGWRWLFAVSALIAAIGLVAGWRLLGTIQAGSRRPGRPIDPWGNALILIALGALLYSLARAQQHGWTDGTVLAGVGIALVAVPLFLVIERRVANPAVHVDLLSDRTFLLANLAGSLLCVPRIAPAIMLSLYYQGLKGMGPTYAALAVTPLAAAIMIGSLAASRLGDHRNERRLALQMTIGTAIGVLTMLIALAIDAGAVWIGIGLIITGFTTGVFSTVNSSMILTAASPDQAGSTNGVRTTFQSAGVSIGVALMLSIIISGVSPAQAQSFYAGNAEQLSGATRSMIDAGYLRALEGMLAIVICATGIGVLLVRRARANQREADRDTGGDRHGDAHDHRGRSADV
jgi:MFS family permease